jgi:hypothetical protein
MSATDWETIIRYLTVFLTLPMNTPHQKTFFLMKMSGRPMKISQKFSGGPTNSSMNPISSLTVVPPQRSFVHGDDSITL